jgi:hypothetical protein
MKPDAFMPEYFQKSNEQQGMMSGFAALYPTYRLPTVVF